MTEDNSDKRNHRIKSDYGVNDYYKFFIKTTGIKHISRSEYGEVIKEFNSYVRDELSTKGNSFVLPCKMGKMELIKSKRDVSIDENGNLRNTMPVNWRETRRIWNENPGMKERNIKIRYTNEHTDGYMFKIIFKKSRANFKNKSIYRIRFNRDMKRKLSKSIFKGDIDAFLNE